MKVANKIRQSTEDKIVNIVAAAIAILLIVISIYPLYYCLIASLSDGQISMGRPMYLLPMAPTLDNYRMVFEEPMLWKSTLMSVLRTVVGTITGTAFTALVAYPLSKDNLRFHKFYSVVFIITMYFGGGVIPQYLVYLQYGIVNTFWVYILPALMNVFNLMLCINFFRDIPKEIIEAARIDGVGEYGMLSKIVFPLSKPIIATLALFTGVNHWNDWFMTAYFTTSDSLSTLPAVLMRLVTSADAQQKINQMLATSSGITIDLNQGPTAESIRYATMLVSILPIVAVYPFIQKYFEKGVMIGAVKA